jgi:hypothetical protein
MGCSQTLDHKHFNKERDMKTNMTMLLLAGSVFASATLSGCGGGSDAAESTALGQSASQLESSSAVITNLKRKRAVESTIASNSFCSPANVGDFYWEIGDQSGKLAGGQRGTTWTDASQMNIASASKWVAGAFVVQKLNPTVTSPLSSAQINALRMHSGYISQSDQESACSSSGSTLQACATAGSNSTLTSSAVGMYRYGSGHIQQLLLNMGYGGYSAGLLASSSTFGTEVRNTLGMTTGAFNDFNYVVPIVAGGVRATPSEYGQFLRKMVTSSSPLKLKAMLGSHSVCTNKNGDCPAAALYSPVPENWKYSLHHWVELDGTFSSPGRNGFYPWIDKDKALYGMLARQAADPTSPAPANAQDYVYWKSVECGRKIRAAWQTGNAQ